MILEDDKNLIEFGYVLKTRFIIYYTYCSSIHFTIPFNRIHNARTNLDKIMALIFMDYKLNKAVSAYTDVLKLPNILKYFDWMCNEMSGHCLTFRIVFHSRASVVTRMTIILVDEYLRQISQDKTSAINSYMLEVDNVNSTINMMLNKIRGSIMSITKERYGFTKENQLFLWIIDWLVFFFLQNSGKHWLCI